MPWLNTTIIVLEKEQIDRNKFIFDGREKFFVYNTFEDNYTKSRGKGREVSLVHSKSL